MKFDIVVDNGFLLTVGIISFLVFCIYKAGKEGIL